ncbi:hypothetical protein CXF68_01350 [Tenacibaculum sp. Bg11-29]|uniref:leucine-rich repeat domain-containing protein n=1 Tax=Tenacibaculum sp. Bg11-29 TaxID=2058306 RepID=UPI000C34908A|nr:leucine-rich repeat domain-containing protein [Tenacibaculum sp. Bg11-29]PKH49412.1 hypothetical protein CXF68_01350 [Tenacibaculum sp. Bg11-29]
MGLREKRIIKAFQNELYPKIEEQIFKAANFDVLISIAWDTLQEDRFSHLYNDTFVKVYFQPLIDGLKAINIDELGGELLRKGLRKIVIENSKNESNPENAISFEEGVLKIDHSPVINADAIESRTKRIIALLEDNLERFSEADENLNGTSVDFSKNKNAFSFEEFNEAITITKYNDDQTTIVIPELINNKKVTKLAPYSFQEMNLEKVILPKTLLSIGKQALDGNKLTHINLPEGLVEVGEDAFYGNQLKTLTLPNSLVVIGDGAFSRNTISILTLSENMIEIPNYCFSNSGITEVKLPLNLKKIGESAFTGNNLAFLNIPRGVDSIGPQAFSESNKLKKVSMPIIFKERIENIFFRSEINNISFEYPGTGLVNRREEDQIKDGSKNEQPKINLSQLHNQSVALTFERQDHFQEIVEDLDWSCDMLEGTVTYGEHVFRMQVLGTYSEKEQSWLWAWANKQSGIPEQFLEASLALKEMGVKYSIEDLTKPKIETENDPGHYFSSVANGVVVSSCYAPLNFKGIKVYVLLTSELVDAKEITEPALICSHFAKTTTRMKFGHKHALFSYLNQKGYKVQLSGNNILATKENDQILGIFDLKNRLLKASNSKIATNV